MPTLSLMPILFAPNAAASLDLLDLRLPQDLEQEARQVTAGQVHRCTLCFEGLCHACTQLRVPQLPCGGTAG